jgi:uncharacterized NAD(P)/FAD-binding protein YdhS
MTRIAIVGAGLSGRLLALNLLRHACPAVRILLIDRGDSRYMGPAYSDPSEHLLLNVPAGRMGALSEDPAHFLTWVRQRGVSADEESFLPRRLYGEYLLDLMHRAQHDRTGGPAFEHVSEEVTDIEVKSDGATICTQRARSFVADKVVLALGNFPPRHPTIENQAAFASRRYVRTPWDSRILAGLAPGDAVVLLGTGQTTVDIAVALHAHRYEGRIVAISRRGILPLAHQGFASYPSPLEGIDCPPRVLDIFRIVRRHMERADSMGIDRRAVIDSLRALTPSLWYNLPGPEKLRFLRHLFRYWEIIRSRIPPSSDAILWGMRESGQLRIVAGRIRDLVETDRAMDVRYTPRGSTTDEVERAAFVINCMGPEADYERIDHPLVRHLMRRGLIRSGPANIGLDARPDGAIVGREGDPSGILYTLGPTMKGILWEVIAVPEIRMQAERLACLLLEESGPVRRAKTWPM